MGDIPIKVTLKCNMVIFIIELIQLFNMHPNVFMLKFKKRTWYLGISIYAETNLSKIRA